jgi:hypothetical protein
VTVAVIDPVVEDEAVDFPGLVEGDGAGRDGGVGGSSKDISVRRTHYTGQERRRKPLARLGALVLQVGLVDALVEVVLHQQVLGG